MRKTKGFGGGKDGGGEARTPREDPDSLRSKQYAKVVDAICEGEIEGLVNGLRSVYLNGTPLQNSDGSFNFNNINLVSRLGTQGQTYVPGFSSIESENSVATEVAYDTPLVRTITNENVNAVRLTFSIPRLTEQNMTNGDLKGTTVKLAVDLQSDGGGYVPFPIERGYVLSGQNLETYTGQGDGAQLYVKFQHTASEVVINGEDKTVYSPIVYTVEYKQPMGAWTVFETGTIVEDPHAVEREPGEPPRNTRGFSEKTFTTAEGDHGEWAMRLTIASGGTTAEQSFYVLDYISEITITGKTTTLYQKAIRAELVGDPPWDIRVRRVTEDSTSSALSNQTYWSSYTEIIDAKLSYPNTALVGITIDSEQFNNIPTRGYDIRGLKAKIPANYDPLTREYTGAWDGTFDVAWTDNPAWCFYDLITNDRYGLGQFISEDQIDKWTLYEIAQYCDELVDDGYGNAEPRFTCNLYLQSREEAFTVIQNMASIFRGLVYWGGGAIVPVQDSPSEPVALFTPANVIGGVFNYQGSSLKARHTVALVSWNDPADRYRAKIEYIDDVESIEQLGIVQTEVVAFGCTSRGQAHRFGRAILYSERMETEVVSFRAGLDAAYVTPGSIIQTSDPIRAGQRMGGRVVSATISNITLDQTVSIESGLSYTLWGVLPDGTVESQEVLNSPGDHSTLVTTDFSIAPQAMSMWVLGASNLIPETWRVITVSLDGTEVEVSAVSYREDKYGAIENDLILEPLPVSSLNTIPTTPANVTIDEDLYMVSPSVVGTRITVSWTGNSPFYDIQYRSGGNWTSITTKSTSIDIQPVEAGTYEFKLNAVNQLGRQSSPVYVTKIIYGLRALPADVDDFSLNAVSGTAMLTWRASSDLDVVIGGYMKIRHTPETVSPEWNNAIDIGSQIPGTATNTALPLLSGTYLAKWVDSTGNESENAVTITTTAPSIISLNFVSDLEQSPGFAGTKEDVVYTGSGIKLGPGETIGQQTGFVSTWPLLSLLGGLASDGTYYFDDLIDLGTVQTCRVTGSLTASGFDELDKISNRGLVSTWPSVSGTLVSGVDCRIYIRTTDGDPNTTSATWSDWTPFVMGDYSARGFEFKAVLTTESETANILVTQLSVQIDMPDRIDSGDDISSGAGSHGQNYNFTFMIPPAIGITAQDMATGDYYEISNKSETGFDIIFKNSSGTAVDRTFDYIARAY